MGIYCLNSGKGKTMVNKYTETLYALINKPDPPYRLFYGTCPDCKKKLWSIHEEVNEENGTIKAGFFCPDCKKKFKQVVYKRNSKKGYRYEQGIVEDYTRGKKVYRVIRTYRALYIVLPDKILLKMIKRKGDE